MSVICIVFLQSLKSFSALPDFTDNLTLDFFEIFDFFEGLYTEVTAMPKKKTLALGRIR